MSKIYADLKARAGPFPPLRQLLVANGHVPLPRRRSACLYDAMARTLVGQQLSNHAAKAIWQRLWDVSKGEPYALCGPSGDRKLRSCGLSATKARALLELRAAFAKGVIQERAMLKLEHQQRSAVITSLWGFGQWSADMLAIFYFRDPDIWSPGDLALRRGLEHVSAGSVRRQRAILSQFTPKKSYLCLHLWRGSPNALSGKPAGPHIGTQNAIPPLSSQGIAAHILSGRSM